MTCDSGVLMNGYAIWRANGGETFSTNNIYVNGTKPGRFYCEITHTRMQGI